jgi:hypothetical protein
MKKVKYVGSGVESLSRFGRVKKGDIIEMYEYEFDCVSQDKDFENLTPELSKEEKSIAVRVKPLGTTLYDLRGIAWENKNLVKYLTARMSKQMLISIIKSINEIGGYIEDSDVNDSREKLVDRIVSASRAMDWDKLTIEDRQELPCYSHILDEDSFQQTGDSDQDKKTTRQRARKQVEV